VVFLVNVAWCAWRLRARRAGRMAADSMDLRERVVAGRVLGEGRPMVHVRKNGSHY
jgi:hypothetical protein